MVAKFAACVVDTGGNLPPVLLTPVVATGVVDATWLANISANFRKNSKWS
jgi:hypothetical protein